MNKFLLSALVPLALCSSASADVNMRDGSFLQTWTDLTIQSQKAPSQKLYKLERTYNSRSLRQGIFGFGWCSEIETSIRWQGGQTYISDCQGLHKELLIFRGQYWWRKMENGAFQKFNSQGWLMAFQKSSTSPLISLEYENDLLKLLKVSSQQIRFSYHNGNLQLSQIELFSADRSLSKLAYSFQNQNLTAVTRSGATLRLQYDDLHNLIETGSLKISYDTAKDQVRSIRTHDMCQENYAYEKLTELVHKSDFERICPGQKKLTRSFRFEALGKNLKQISLTENNRPPHTIRTGELNDSKDLP